MAAGQAGADDREIVRSDPGLGERELRKRASLSESIGEGFRERGLPPMTAALLNVSIQQWLNEDGDRHLQDFAEEALASLQGILVCGAPVWTSGGSPAPDPAG